jgi:hypothetical protein
MRSRLGRLQRHDTRDEYDLHPTQDPRITHACPKSEPDSKVQGNFMLTVRPHRHSITVQTPEYAYLPVIKAPAPDTDCIEHQPDQANVFTPRLDRFRQVELSKYEPERYSPAGSCSRDESCMDSLYCANETTVLGQHMYVLAFPPDWADSNLCRHRSGNEQGNVFTPYLWLVHILFRQSYSVHYVGNDLILMVDTGSKHGGIHMA